MNKTETLSNEELDALYKPALNKYEELNTTKRANDNNKNILHLNKAFGHLATLCMSKR